ncbi:MAG: hypothetical protein CL799_06240 [Chromatiales bacterium]|nr:hypothetical protein [Chromatiales bacterium]
MPRNQIKLTALDRLAVESEGYVHGTMRNHRSRINFFWAWALDHGHSETVTLDEVRYFLAFLYRNEYVSIPQFASSIFRGGFEEGWLVSKKIGFDNEHMYWTKKRLAKMISRPPFKAAPVTADQPGLKALSKTERGWLALWLGIGCRADSMKNVHAADITLTDKDNKSTSLLGQQWNKLRDERGEPFVPVEIEVRIRKDKKEAKQERMVKIRCNCDERLQRAMLKTSEFCLLHNKNGIQIKLPPDTKELETLRQKVGIAEHSIRRLTALEAAKTLVAGAAWIKKALLQHMGWSKLTQFFNYAIMMKNYKDALFLPTTSIKRVCTVQKTPIIQRVIHPKDSNPLLALDQINIDPQPRAKAKAKGRPKAKAKTKAKSKAKAKGKKGKLLQAESEAEEEPDEAVLNKTVILDPTIDLVESEVIVGYEPVQGVIEASRFLKHIAKLEADREKRRSRAVRRRQVFVKSFGKIRSSTTPGAEEIDKIFEHGDSETDISTDKSFGFSEEEEFDLLCEKYAEEETIRRYPQHEPSEIRELAAPKRGSRTELIKADLKAKAQRRVATRTRFSDTSDSSEPVRKRLSIIPNVKGEKVSKTKKTKRDNVGTRFLSMSIPYLKTCLTFLKNAGGKSDYTQYR